jgi:hypothetical protein
MRRRRPATRGWWWSIAAAGLIACSACCGYELGIRFSAGRWRMMTVGVVGIVRSLREPKFIFRSQAGESTNPFRGFEHPDEKQPALISRAVRLGTETNMAAMTSRRRRRVVPV